MCARPVIRMTGEGPDLVMVHGWGSHSGIWGDFADNLSKHFRLHLVELPGHGDASEGNCTFEAESFANAVAEITPRAVWLGSSLGGLIALHAALSVPEKVSQLVLISVNPSFVSKPGWTHGQSPGVFDQFVALLETGAGETLKHFSKLEVAGSDGARETLAKLRKVQNKLPSVAALRQGLNILGTENLTKRLQELELPCLIIGGAEDRLVPIEALRETAKLIRGSELLEIEGAGHAPFISHTEKVYEATRQFLSKEKAA